MKKNFNSKTQIVFLVLLLMLSIAGILAALPAASAHTPAWNIPTWTYVAFSPNPVGVDQPALIVFWLDKVPYTANGAYGDRFQFTVEVTKPDGTKDTLGPITSDPVGGGYIQYTPTAPGTYYVQVSYPGQTLTGLPLPSWSKVPLSGAAYVNDTLQPSTSEKLPLTVQQDQVSWPETTPLPTDYWTRPIYAANREWSSIAGNWLGDGLDNPYTKGPESAHIVWTKPLDFGGVAGGKFGDLSYYTGSAYEAKFSNPVIMQGRLYYNTPKSDQPNTGGLMSVDLHTGQTIWYMNNTRISMGAIYDYESPNQHGTIPYLIYTGGGLMQFYDPFSGIWLFTITNVPSGTSAVGPSGEPLIYQWNMSAGWLACWNSSAIRTLLLGETSGTNEWQWRPVGKTVNGSLGYSWNATIPKDSSRGSRDLVNVVYKNKAPEMILCTSGCIDRWYTTNPFTIYAISLKPGQEGTLLWRKSVSLPIANCTIDPGYGIAVDPDNRIFVLPIKETNQWYGFNLDSGQQVWGPSTAQPAFDSYRMLPYPLAVNGKFYAGGYSGILHCFDIKTGELLWNSSTAKAGLDAPYEYYPIGSGAEKSYADGKLYITTYEHSTTMPLYRGWSVYCFDAETGKALWNITGLMGQLYLADGYAVGLDGMDNQIYCFGKGQTATEVTASPKVSALGDSVLIEGTVTDQSPGVKDSPAISDDDMTVWMEYWYHQKSMPKNVQGVEVTLDAYDPNGNFINIGAATSDASGLYKKLWTPDTPGEYTIIATFAGSKSYFSSYAETAIGITQAKGGAITPTPITTPTLTGAPTQSPGQTASPSPSSYTPPAVGTPTTTYIAIGAAIVVVIVAAAAIILRRRK